MEDVQPWLTNGYNSVFSKSPPSLSSSSATTSQETHSSPTLCEDTSFNSLGSNSSTQTTAHYPHNYHINYPIPKPSVISPFTIASFKTTTPNISCLVVQNNSLYAATMNEINVFDLATLSLVDSFGSGLVKSIAFSNGKIFTAHQDSKIRVWKQIPTSSSRKQKHQQISTLPTLKDRLSKCVLPKNYIQVRRHKRKLWIDHADAVSGLATNNDAGLMYSVSWDRSLKIWKVSSDMRCLESIRVHSDAVNAIVVNLFDGTIYTGSADGQIKVWTTSEDRKKHRLLTTLTKHESSVNALELNGEGSALFSGGGDGVILVWERENRDDDENEYFVGCSMKGHRGAVLCLVCVNDGVVVSGSSDRSVRIWKYGKGFGGCCLAVLEVHRKPVKSLVAIPGLDGELVDGFSVLSGSLDGEIRAWKVVVSDDSD